MLQFLRKHQKVLFIVITIAIVISFTFFGTYGAMTGGEPQENKELFKGITGRPVMERELGALSRLIATSPFDQERGIPNLLNDGVIEKDFLSSGLGVMLAKQYFDALKPELDKRAKRVKSFRPYVHPYAPHISVEAIWSRFSPSFLSRYKMLKAKSDQSTAETFALLAQVYLEQARLPSETLRQVLHMQQNQTGIKPDPMLGQVDFSLFGFKSLSDWFGPDFVNLSSQFILNAAQLAVKSGYDVKREEVRAELFQNIYNGYGQASRQGQLSVEEAQRYYENAMHSMGMDEEMLIQAWRNVMLCRRLFDDAGGSVIADPLTVNNFQKFTKEVAHVDLYELPAALKFSDFRSMLKFQVYLETLSAAPARTRTDLLLTRQFSSLDQIEKRAPELVERNYRLEWTTVNMKELTGELSLKETWEWQVKDAHWDLLRKNFPEIAALSAQTKHERLTALDKIDNLVRTKVDQFARRKMVEARPEKILAALQKANPIQREVGIRTRGGSLPFQGVKEQAEFASLLEKSSLKGESLNSAAERLRYFTADGDNFYQIEVVHRAPEKKILLFADAARDGTLDQLLDKRLEAAYPDARRKEPHHFQQNGGQFKPFNEVKDKVAKIYFSDLLTSIEEGYQAHYGQLPGNPGDLPLQFYSNARTMAFMKEAKRYLEINPSDPLWIDTDISSERSFENQWRLVKTEKALERCTPLAFSKKELFSAAPGHWSAVHVGEGGNIAFYFLKSRSAPNAAPLESLEKAHQILSMDAKRDLMQRILSQILESGSINLSHAKESL